MGECVVVARHRWCIFVVHLLSNAQERGSKSQKPLYCYYWEEHILGEWCSWHVKINKHAFCCTPDMPCFLWSWLLRALPPGRPHRYIVVLSMDRRHKPKNITSDHPRDESLDFVSYLIKLKALVKIVRFCVRVRSLRTNFPATRCMFRRSPSLLWKSWRFSSVHEIFPHFLADTRPALERACVSKTVFDLKYSPQKLEEGFRGSL